MLAVLLTAIAIVAAVAVVFRSGGDQDEARTALVPLAQDPATPRGPAHDPPLDAGEPAGEATTDGTTDATTDDGTVRGSVGAGPRGGAPRTVESAGGTGTIRGVVQPPEGRELPPTWSVRVGPSLFLPGRANAVERTVEHSDPSGEFRVEDLPFGGYSVWVIAEGMNCLPVQVGVDRRSDSPYVTLVLSPAGYLEGSVVDELGGLVEGLQVWLEGLPSGQRTSATTDVGGTYRFERVLDGMYKLYLGHPDNPIVPPRTLAFQAPSMHVPPREVPALATLEVRVLDDFATPLEGATVRGTGNAGGWFTLQTDERGEVRARFLPPGRYRVHAMHPERGNTSDQVELEKGDTQALELVLRR